MNQPSPGITWKSISITLLLIPFSFYWIISGEVGYVGYALNTYAVPFYNVIFILLCLTLLNAVGRKLFRISGLHANELLTVYILLSAACSLPSITFMTLLVTTVGHAAWYATPENEWQRLFIDRLPDWSFVKNRSVLQGYYEGDSTLYTVEHLSAWATPVLVWTLFTTCLIFVMLCLNVILRRQWVERERLAYPVAQISLQISHSSTTTLRSKVMWVGFVIAASIALFNGLAFLFPTLPTIPVKRIGGWQGFGHLFTDKPWNAIGGISLSFYPFVIGLGLLMPLDLTFSCWLFFILYKAQLVLSSAMGISVPGFPYPGEQNFGAALGVLFAILWVHRRYLGQVVQTAYRPSLSADAREPVSYRTALLGFASGGLLLCGFSAKIGMALWLMPLFFGVYTGIILMITRMRAELGFPVHAMENMSTHNILVSTLGTRTLGADNLVALSIYRWFNRSFTSHPMPHQMEGFKLAERSGLNTHRLFFAQILVTFVGAVAVFGVILHLFYRVGAINCGGGGWSVGFGGRVFGGLQRWLYYPTEPNPYAIGGIAVGLLSSLGLMFMRARFLWWHLHPIGYVIASDWGMRYLWSCMLVSSVLKWGVLRFAGMRATRQLTQFAIGLMLGDFTVGSFWSLMSVITRMPMYNFWP